jgi:hypothetical protein
MIAKCECQYCSGPLEFEVTDFQESGQGPNGKIFGQYIPCPHCSKQTIIYLEKSASASQTQDTVRAFLKRNDESQFRSDSSDSRVEDQLETAGGWIFIIGIVGFLASAFLAAVSSQIVWLIVGFAAVFQGWIFSLLFKGFAEVIRLLRRK